MGADDEPRPAVRDARQGILPGLARDRPGEQNGLQIQRRDHLRERALVLLRQQLRGGHDRRLATRLDRLQHGERGDDGLSAAHIPLEEPVHRCGAAHVAFDVGPGAALAAREVEGESIEEGPRERGFGVEGDPLRFQPQAGAGAGVQQLEEEEFLEREPALRSRDPIDVRRAVQIAQGFGERRETEPAQPGVRDRLLIAEFGQQAGQVQSDDGAHLPVREPLRGRIDREDAARRGPFAGRSAIVGLSRQHRVLAGLKLRAVIEAHRPGREQQIALVDRAVQPRPPRPRALDVPAVVTDHGPKHPQLAPRRDDALGDDAPDDRRVLAHPQPGDRIHGRRVLVAVRQVVEEVAPAVDAKLREPLGPPGPNALQVLHRPPQEGSRGRHGLSRPGRGSCRDTVRARTPPGRPATLPRRGSGRARKDRAPPRRRCPRAPRSRTSRARAP